MELESLYHNIEYCKAYWHLELQSSENIHLPPWLRPEQMLLTYSFWVLFENHLSVYQEERGKLSINSQEFNYWPWAMVFKKLFTCKIGFRGLASSERWIKCCLDSKCCLFSKCLCSTCCLCSRCCLFSNCCLWLLLTTPTPLLDKLRTFERKKNSSRNRHISWFFSSCFWYWGMNSGRFMHEANALPLPCIQAPLSNVATILSFSIWLWSGQVTK